jgi:hypothetical protein
VRYGDDFVAARIRGRPTLGAPEAGALASLLDVLRFEPGRREQGPVERQAVAKPRYFSETQSNMMTCSRART